MMERLLFRSTGIVALQAELRRHELLREARLQRRGLRGEAGSMRDRRSWSLPDSLRLLVRRLAG